VAGGWLAGTNAARLARGLEPISLPATSMIGALTHFIAEAPSEKFQPMPPNFGLLPELPERIRDKRRRYGAYRDRALAAISELVLNGNRTGAGSSGDLALSAPSRG
jgi:methylenetetrahydrofolate--tRNA-(uracil-5-)-methyltransferase